MTPFSGYTLPVFASAAAVAAILSLRGESPSQVTIDLLEPPTTAIIPIEQVAKLGDKKALAITRSEPGDNLDLTRLTPIWGLVELGEGEGIIIEGGQGVGKHLDGSPAIYSYAQKLIKHHLQRHLLPGESVKVTIILPEGQRLAQRTSNQAFGVVEGLSLLGIGGISQPLSSPEQLAIYQEDLATKAKLFDTLVFCIGENGLDLAQRMGINPSQLVKTANWLGPMLASAGVLGVSSILLFGYHGKLIKLAGGIFHTHHHLADGRLAILTAHLGYIGAPIDIIQKVFNSATLEAAFGVLRDWNVEVTQRVYQQIAATIDRRTQEYIYTQSEAKVQVGSLLFGKERSVIVTSNEAIAILLTLTKKYGVS